MERMKEMLNHESNIALKIETDYQQIKNNNNNNNKINGKEHEVGKFKHNQD